MWVLFYSSTHTQFKEGGRGGGGGALLLQGGGECLLKINPVDERTRYSTTFTVLQLQ